MAWAVRGRSSQVFGPCVWRGNPARRELALTFDDGPSPSTAVLLTVLDKYKAPATFFQCGMHVRRYPTIARDIVAAGHEIGNHTDTHPRLWLQSPEFILAEIHRAQVASIEVTGVTPRLFRPTYGVRWFGMQQALEELGLAQVMWSTIGLDWKFGPIDVANRIVRGAKNGAIYCLHDAREREADPDIRVSVDAVKRVLPALMERGYRFRTVSELLR
jgi:peptidoglycan/xylan/chitin deacetylase (PgdA/CDA1 family)